MTVINNGFIFLFHDSVVIQEENSGKEYEVVGRFPLVGPWWRVNVKAKKTGSKYFVQGYPSYFLRTDIEENNRQVFSLFLKECAVPEDFKEKFFTWLPTESMLNFRNLEEKLKQFQVSHIKTGKKQRDTQAYDIFHYVSKSLSLTIKNFAGKAVLVALTFPMLLEFLPILLPRHFYKILTELDEILKNEPWKLGFSRKITYRELNLSYCEATWAAFCQCERLLWKIPDLQKNALILYDQLKKQCREMGHTYEDQDELARLVSKDMSIENVWQSLEFLKAQNVVIREKKLVFLPHLYKSEKDIAMYVGRLLSNCSWQLDVDVRKILNASETPREMVDNKMDVTQACEMEHLKENNPDSHNCENCFPENKVGSTSGTQSKAAEVDLDQVTAMEKICSNPVTIISGKGGCGKSTIVSCLFRHLKQMEKEVEAASKDFEEDLDASEEWNTFDHHRESENMYTKKLVNVLFTAPTGRAASLLSKKTKLPAYTLHQTPAGAKPPHSGDTRQLPSIDPGNMLADIFEGLKSRGFSVELQTNHRAESQLIVDNASRQDCDLINELCCQHYSNHLTRDHKKRLLFQIDDKISCTRNIYLKDLLPDRGFGEVPNRRECKSGETSLTTETAEEGKRLCNGDIFFITGVSPCCKNLHRKRQW
uniref:DNA helicase B n=1 Tax=Strix occidentalis caurina TaxID=311401 RepID=A0A8D0F4Z9_STROC